MSLVVNLPQIFFVAAWPTNFKLLFRRIAPAFADKIFGFDNEVPVLYYIHLSAVEFACNAATAREDSGKNTKLL
jgi:hypothetical protein